MSRRCARWILVIALAPCGACRERTPPVTLSELQGSAAERVARAVRIVLRDAPPPGPVVDAHCAEERLGDDIFGPADRRTFCELVLAPATLDRWSGALPPAAEPVAYASPARPLSWWPTAAAVSEFAPVAPASFKGVGQGWVAVDRKSGRIYVYSFST